MINKETSYNFLWKYDIWYSKNKENIEKELNNDIKLHKEFLSLARK